MARPSKYYSHVEPKLNLVESWARDGLIDEQIANNLDISLTSYYEYKNKYTEFAEALKNGKDDIDIMVENALLKRAMGYSFEEVTRESVPCKAYEDENGNTVEHTLMVTKVVTKEVQPDTTAQIFWLKNRRPQAWRDKQEVGLSGGLNNTTQNLTDMSPEERRARIDELNRRRGIGAPAAT